jgi:hypothetical protein
MGWTGLAMTSSLVQRRQRMWWVIAEAGRRFRRSQWWPALVTGLLRNATLLPAASFEVILSQAPGHARCLTQ